MRPRAHRGRHRRATVDEIVDDLQRYEVDAIMDKIGKEESRFVRLVDGELIKLMRDIQKELENQSKPIPLPPQGRMTFPKVMPKSTEDAVEYWQ